MGTFQGYLCGIIGNAALNPECKIELRKIGAQPPLLELIDSPDDNVQGLAAGALANINDRSEMRPGTPGSALTSSDDPVKTQAAKLRFNGSRTSTEWDPNSSTQSVTSLPQDDSAGARPKNQFPLTPTVKLSSTHDLK